MIKKKKSAIKISLYDYKILGKTNHSGEGQNETVINKIQYFFFFFSNWSSGHNTLKITISPPQEVLWKKILTNKKLFAPPLPNLFDLLVLCSYI